MGCWHRPESSGAPGFPFILTVQNTAGSQWDAINISTSGAVWKIETNVGSSGSTARTAGAWANLMFVRESATSAKLYLDGTLIVTYTGDVGTGRTANYLAMGFVGAAGYQAHGDTFGVKIWDRALTLAEVVQEMRTVRPANMLSINSWFPMLPGRRTIDQIYGRNFTEAGTWSDADGPPVSWGGSPILVNNPAAAGGIILPPFIHHYKMQGIL